MQTENYHQDYVFKKLSLISESNQEFESLVALLASILRDLNALFELTQKGSAWRDLFQEVLTSLDTDNASIRRFQHKLLNFTLFEARKLVVSPSVNLSSERIKCLYAIRGLIVLWHLDHDQKIPLILSGQLEILFKAQSNEALSLIQNLSVELESLVNLNEQYPPTHKWFKFISTLIHCLQDVEIGPKINQKSRHTTFSIEQKPIGSSANASEAAEHVSGNKRTYTVIHETGDLLRYNFAGLSRLFRKDFSGIPNLFKHYHPDELQQFMPAVVKNYLINHDEIAFVLLLCLIFRCHVSRFHLISLCPNKDSNIWLDLDDGFLVWNRQALIKKNDEVEPVKIPLPVELTHELRTKFQQDKNAKDLGELFGDRLPVLKKQVRKFTFTNSISSHKAFITRLHFSYGRFVLHLCKDEVYAAAIAVDFSLGVTANFNYVVLDPTRINNICEDVYRRLGFSGEFLNPVTIAVGSSQGQDINKVVKILNRYLENAQIAFSEIHNRSNLNQLILAHNKIVLSLTLLIAITCGLRRAREYSICNHTLDIKNGLTLVTDKASTEYLTCRVIPIPDLTRKWLVFYKNWLKSLAQRMSGKSKQICAAIASISDSECCLGGIPLLFYFHRGKIKPVGSKHIHLIVQKEGLESNLGRHFLDRILRNSLGSMLLNAHAGRANLGQESFGMRSALALTDAIRELKDATDKELTALNVLLPPQNAPVRYSKSNLTKPYHPYAWQKLFKWKNQLGEACPYGELTLVNARNFERLIEYWVSSDLKKDIGQLAISLILMDGVVHEEEVLAALEQLIHGRILEIGDDYFVDIDTPALGIRRVNLSSITLCLINAVVVSEDPLSEAVVRLKIENAISQLFSAVGLSAKKSLKAVAEMAEDFYSVRVPGALREWMCGRQHGRTLRPETLIRHQLQLKERLSELGAAKPRKGKVRSDQAVVNALNEACDKEKNKDSNPLRMKKLASVLEGMDGAFFSLADNILARYAWFLSSQCPKIKSPTSVRTHFYGVKQLVQNICLDIEDLDEINAIDWQEVATNFLGDETDERRVASLNYLLRLFKQPEIKSLKKDEARASRTYSEFPSTAEVELAIKLIDENEHLNEYQKLAALMLRLMALAPLRAEDIASLRVCDVFIGESSFIVITSAATGSRKSDNANRVLFLTDPDLVSQLKALQKIRIALSSETIPTTSLFGSTEQLRSFEGTEELLSIIADALRCATGSNFVRPHSLRSKYLSEKFRDALMPQNKTVDALRQRNILYEISVTAGHADPDVSIKNYVCDFNLIRRSWVDKLILGELKPSAKFLASISSCGYEAWRKRLQRNFFLADLNKEFKTESNPKLKLRIHDLAQSHQMNNYEYELVTDKESESVNLETQTAQFVACLLLGMEKDAAAAYINIPNEALKDIESNFNIFVAHKGSDFFTELKAGYERFKVGEIFVRLAQYFGLWAIDAAQAAHLLRLLPSQMEKPLVISIKDIPFTLEFLSPRLQRAGFNLTVLIPDVNTQVNSEMTAQLNRMGVRRVEKSSRRNFAAKGQYMALFRESGNMNPTHLCQKITNFEINIFMLAFLIKNNIKG